MHKNTEVFCPRDVARTLEPEKTIEVHRGQARFSLHTPVKELANIYTPRRSDINCRCLETTSRAAGRFSYPQYVEMPARTGVESHPLSRTPRAITRMSRRRRRPGQTRVQAPLTSQAMASRRFLFLFFTIAENLHVLVRSAILTYLSDMSYTGGLGGDIAT